MRPSRVELIVYWMEGLADAEYKEIAREAISRIQSLQAKVDVAEFLTSLLWRESQIIMLEEDSRLP
jgi:hypothetical protein